MNAPVAMPFSGGMDSFANLYYFRKAEPETPVHFFYFEHGYEAPGEMEIAEQIIFPSRLHVVPMDLLDLTRQPSTFVPFRNLFFGLYLFGLGFERVCFSFSAEDTEHYDTSDAFLKDLEEACEKHLHRKGQAFTCLRDESRMSYTLQILTEDEKAFLTLERTHTCISSIPACRKCLTCLKREIAFRSACGDVISDRHFVQHWTQDPVHTYLVDRLYNDCLTGVIKEPVAGEYLRFLNTFMGRELLTRENGQAI